MQSRKARFYAVIALIYLQRGPRKREDIAQTCVKLASMPRVKVSAIEHILFTECAIAKLGAFEGDVATSVGLAKEMKNHLDGRRGEGSLKVSQR
eukprot:756649-Hanusia_phi.AAC.8